MKTTIEIHGYEVVIEAFEDGKLSIQAIKDGDVVEEFEIESDEKPAKKPSKFGKEEIDLGDDDDDDEKEHDDDDDDNEPEEDVEEKGTLESFSTFTKHNYSSRVNESKNTRYPRRPNNRRR